VLLLICASLAAPVPGGAAPRDAEGQPRPGPASIYGLELDVSESRERLLVFADRPLEVETSELDPETLMLSIVDAVLDASAESRIAPAPGGSVRHVSAFERADVPTHEVRIVIRRSAGVQPSVSRRGSITALEFPRSEVPARDPGIALAYRAAPVAVVVRDLARAAGETVVHDAELPGRISVVGSERLSSAEALTLMDTILLSRGLAAVPLPGGGRKIVAIAGAPVPWRPALPEDPGDAQVATLVRLASVEAEALLGVLNPLLGSQTLGVAVPSSNALILAGSSARIARLSVAIEALDAEADERRVILRLRHRDAIDVAPLVREVFDARALPDVLPDERTNALILRVRPSRLPEVRDLVARIDRPPVGPGPLHVLPVQHADPDRIATELRVLQTGSAERGARGAASLSGRDFAIAVDRPTHSLLLRADPETARVVADLLAELDRIPARVLVEVTVAEVTTARSLELGFDYFVPLTEPKSPQDLVVAALGNPSGGGLRALAGQNASTLVRFTRKPLMVPILGPGGEIFVEVPRDSYALTADEREIDVRTVARPRLLVANGEEQRIFVGDNVPVPRAQAGTGSPLEVRQDIERRDVGLQLDVRPTLGEEGGVRLELRIHQSRIAESLAGDSDRVGPSFAERDLSTIVRLDDGEIAVVGFLSGPSRASREVGVPWLRSLPGLGFLFRNTQDVELDSTLLIAVSATLQREGSRQLAMELRRHLEETTAALP
jgi:general secretion pathway protein D